MSPLVVLSVTGSDNGGILVTFSGPVDASTVDPTQFTCTIDGGVSPALQCGPNAVSFYCPTSSAGNPWTTTTSFAPGVAASSGMTGSGGVWAWLLSNAGSRNLSVIFNVDVAGDTPTPGNVVLNGIPATVAVDQGPGSFTFNFQNSSLWPVNISGATVAIAGNTIPGLLPVSGIVP